MEEQRRIPIHHKLDGKGNEPLCVACRYVARNTIIDPESDRPTDLPAKLIHANEATTDSRRRDFSDVNGLLIGDEILGEKFRSKTHTAKFDAAPIARPTITRPAYIMPRPVLDLWRVVKFFKSRKGENARSGSLHGGTYTENKTSEEKTPSATPIVTNRVAENCAKEAAVG